MDTFSKSDPFAILFLQRGSVWQKIGQTEVIHDNLNPRWVQKITVDYHFEQQEKFKVQVFDSDDDKQLQNLQSHDFIGEIEFQLHEVVTTRD
jgi:Ca2+-dependent lipid-binding protein